MAPSPDPERFDIKCGESIRFHGLLDHYDTIVVPYGDVIDEREKAALDTHVDKLIFESPQIYAQTILER